MLEEIGIFIIIHLTVTVCMGTAFRKIQHQKKHFYQISIQGKITMIYIQYLEVYQQYYKLVR